MRGYRLKAIVLLVASFLCIREASADAARQVRIGGILWYTDYESAMKIARAEHKPLWMHFGENPGCFGCRNFAKGPLSDARLIRMSRDFIPVFVDTLHDDAMTQRFHENPGSYPVLRVLNLYGQDIAERLDGNAVLGNIPLKDVQKQLQHGLEAFGEGK